MHAILTVLIIALLAIGAFIWIFLPLRSMRTLAS